MKKCPFLSGFGARLRKAAAWAALAAAMSAGTAVAATVSLYINDVGVTNYMNCSGTGWKCEREWDAYTLYFQRDMEFVVTGEANVFNIEVDSDCTIVASNFVSGSASSFTVKSGHTLELALADTNNVFTGGSRTAGLTVEEGASLVITGDGALRATGGDMGAGIGSPWGKPCGNITISLSKSGTVTATGGINGAGIGGSYLGGGGNITIASGNVTADGGLAAAGIGGGYGAACGSVTISGGNVKATGNGDAAGIGGGKGGDGGTVTISDGSVTATSDGDGAGIGGGWSNSFVMVSISGGTVTAASGGDGAGIGGGSDRGGGTITISGGTVTATAGGDGAGIGGGKGGDGGTIIIVGGELQSTGGNGGGAGIGGGNGGAGGSIGIQNGTVTATGNGDGAGIGGGNNGAGGTIGIQGGTVTATGSGSGAGIGGGSGGDGGDVTIVGGEVTASSDSNGAGIGGGSGGNGGTVTISDGTVTAKSFGWGAGIGGGFSGSGGTIGIKGGSVTAASMDFGAGIGGGWSNSCESVTISGGTVTATGGPGGAGIGGGSGGSGGTVSITGGEVQATGGSGGAGLGGGSLGAGVTNAISGGTVTATGGDGAAGIGGGCSNACGTVTISGGTVTATAGTYAAGIGGGQKGTGGTVAISDGTVTATGGQGSAGIGGGETMACESIEISGGTVTATGGAYGAGIGNGCFCAGGSIAISGGIVTANGGAFGAGIGGGQNSAGGSIAISGGTIHPTGNSASAIGDGYQPTVSGTNTFTGGTIFATFDAVSPGAVNAAPTNVFPVTLDLGATNVAVTNFSGHADYGIKDVWPDGNGNVVFWLPPTGGTQKIDVTLDGESEPHTFYYIIEPDGKVTIADTFFVNGELVVGGIPGSGTGWTHDTNGVVSLTDASASYTLQGEATNGFLRFSVPGGAAGLTLDGVTILATNADSASGIALSGTVPVTFQGTNAIAARGRHAAGIALADDANVTISGDGTLALAGNANYGAGIEVGGNARLTLAADGLIVANGGKFAAGIGSRGGNTPCGHIEIRSGKVVATGGNDAAGIGGGANSTLQEDSIVISGGVVEGHGGAYAAGIGAGRGSLRLPDGAVRISGGSVSAYGDLTEAATGSLDGSLSRSDFAESQGNVVPFVENEFKSIVITGGSAVPGTLAKVSPRPVDAESNLLYRVLMGGFEAGSAVAITSDGIPAGYSTDGIVADAGGRVCLWLPPSDDAIEVEAGGKFFATPAPFDNDADLENGSDLPEYIIPDEPECTNTLWLVTVPGLDPHVQFNLSIQAEKTVEVFSQSDDQGRFLFYVADGEYVFKLNDLEFYVLVDGGPATAIGYDPDHPTGVLVNGIDVCIGLGKEWIYDSGSRELLLSGESFVLSGSNTEGRVQVVLATNATLTVSNLTLAVTNGAAAIAIPAGASVSLVLAGSGGSSLSGGPNHPAIGVPEDASLEIGGDGDLRATGGANAAGIGGGASCGMVKIAGVNVEARGGQYGAGIGGGDGGTGGIVHIDGGNVTSVGGENGAGIGGGRNGTVGSIQISGGAVQATGGDFAAGIGGGHDHQDGKFFVSVEGGRVMANGGQGAAGIGSEISIPGGAIFISGGTIYPKCGANAPAPIAIGDGCGPDSTGSGIFIGGTIFATVDAVSPAAINVAGAPLWPVEVPELAPNAAVTNLSIVEVHSGAADYGTNDIYADENGTVVLWLPDGVYRLDAEDIPYVATVAGSPTTALRIHPDRPTGVFVDGTDVCMGVGKGWSYDDTALALAISGDGLVLSGTNTEGRVLVDVTADVLLTLSNLTLAVTGEAAPLSISAANATVELAGTNALAAGTGHAAIEVPDGAQLVIGGEGTLDAHGGENGAGIGGGHDGTCGIVSIRGGTVTATGGKNGAGIGACLNGKTGGSVSISGGTVTANGGIDNAGIGGSVGFVAITGGTITATGLGGGAGIGADAGLDAVCPAITVSGGTITATGGGWGAGIGGGQDSSGSSISISGGFVTANGSTGVACIGGINGFSGGNIAISGGTIHVKMDSIYDNQIAIGAGDGNPDGTNTFTGGTIFATVGQVSPAAVGAGDLTVWPVTVPGLAPNARVSGCTILDAGGNPFAYGDKDLFASDDGTLVLWLPNGTYTLNAGGFDYIATVADGPVTASRITGVFVDGIDVGAGTGTGWSFDWNTCQLILSADGLVLSGTNVHGVVQVSVAANLSLTVGNLTLSAASNSAAIAISPGVSATLVLAGENTLCGGEGCPAIEVPGGAALEITGDGWLDATGGWGGAGIGGGTSCGSITISGGTVNATGDSFSAGIGGGGNGPGGTVVVNGGTVNATGGLDGAGIGGGSTASGGTVIINGGTVAATGGAEAAGIGGGGRGGSGGTVTIAGGKVRVANGSQAACIGGGLEGAAADVSITGGTIDFAHDGNSLFFIGCGTFQGYHWPTNGSTFFGGGSILFTNAFAIRCTATNAANEQVYPVVFTDFPPGYRICSLSVFVNEVPCDYGINDLFASDAGEFILWLPNGRCRVNVNGMSYTAVVDGDMATAEPNGNYPKIGVFVDGVDVGKGSGNGWTYDENGSLLTLAGTDLVLGGTDTNGAVRVVLGNTDFGGRKDFQVTASNLTLVASGEAAAISFASRFGNELSLTLTLAGENTLGGGANHPAIEVRSGTTLLIQGDGALSATGGDNAAGIGGANEASLGDITIAGGTVTARGGANGAGIGNGARGEGGGSVTISNATVTATGGASGAGIGGGDHGDGCNVTIQGGIVTATGGDNAAGIGGGDGTQGSSFKTYSSGNISIYGGIVNANGGKNAAAIGAGTDGEGGSISIYAGTVAPTVHGGRYAIGGSSEKCYRTDVLFDGGTIFTTEDMVYPEPRNRWGRSLGRVVVTNLVPGAAVTFTNLPDYYGLTDIYADAEGKVVLWPGKDDWNNGASGDNKFTFFANGYEYTVSFGVGVNAAQGSVTAAQGGALPLENLEIVGCSCDGGTVKLHVVAEPATWTHGFADTLSVRRVDSLVPGAEDAPADAKPVLSSDGTVSFSLPFDSTNRTAFFFISGPREE